MIGLILALQGEMTEPEAEDAFDKGEEQFKQIHQRRDKEQQPVSFELIGLYHWINP